MQDDCVNDLVFIVAASITELMTSRDFVLHHSLSLTPLLPDIAKAADEEDTGNMSNVVSISSMYVM